MLCCTIFVGPILWIIQAWDNVSQETIQKSFVKCGFGAEEVGTEEVIKLPPHDKHFSLWMIESG